MTELDFDTFDDFIKKFPLDEITLPIGIQAPDEEGDYWLIQVALPMKNKVIDCCIWNANQQHVSKYRLAALSLYKNAIQLPYEVERRSRARSNVRL